MSLRCEQSVREAYVQAQQIAESHRHHLEGRDEPALTPFWELRLIERLTLALYLERSCDGLNANSMLAYHSGSKLLEGAEQVRLLGLMTPAVEDLLAPIKLEADAKVSIRTTALASDALAALEEQDFDRPERRPLGNWR